MTLPGVDPTKLQQLQEVTKDISAKLTVSPSAGTLSLELMANSEQAGEVVPTLLDQLATSLGQQLRAFFAIKGELVKKK